MSTPVEDSPPVSRATLLLIGPVFIGALFSWLLFGISTVQLYIYSVAFTSDRKAIQAIVYLVYVLDIFQTVAVTSMGWHMLCKGWGREIALVRPGWTWAAICAADSITASLVQFFYAWRIHKIKSWIVVPVAICMVSLAQLGATLYISAGLSRLQDIAGVTALYTSAIFWLGGGALADVMISISMVYVLYMAKKNSYILQKDNTVLNRLIRLSVETGIASSVTAIVELGLFLGSKGTNAHLAFALILGKVYSNSLMTSLNSRVNWRSTPAGSANASEDVSGLRATGRSAPGRVSVHIASRREIFRSGRSDTDATEDDVFTTKLDKDNVEMYNTRMDDSGSEGAPKEIRVPAEALTV